MLKKMTFVVCLLFAVLGHKNGLFPMDANGDERFGLEPRVRSVDEGPKKVKLTFLFSPTEESDQNDRDEEFKELKEELDSLIEEMKELEKAAREKVLKEILPLIREEIEKLREKLRKWQKEEEEEPTQVKGTEI